MGYVGVFEVEPTNVGGFGVFAGENAEVEGEGIVPREVFAALFEPFEGAVERETMEYHVFLGDTEV